MRVFCERLQLSIEAPADWTQRGALILSSPRRKGVLGAAVVTARNDPPRPGETLHDYAEAWRRELAASVLGFELQELFEAVLGGCSAVCICFSWDAPFGRAEQTVAFVERGLARTTLTLTAPIDELPQMRETFAAILRSVRFGTACYAPPERLSPPPSSRITP
jgi:hypothetical protein